MASINSKITPSIHLIKAFKMSKITFLFRQIEELLKQYIRENNQNKLNQILKSFCDWYLKVYWNEKHWDMKKNGELLVLEKVTEYFEDTKQLNIFDVGANSGKYTQRVIEISDNAKIHCFEIVPDLASQLDKNFNQHQNITVNHFGLSDKKEELDVHFFPDSLTQARIHSRKNMQHVLIKGYVIRGDEYITNNQIDYIHLVKIDTEGHERFVIQGLQNALDNQMIGVIQFEYGRTYLASRAHLYDIYEFLEPRGFRIGRLFPTGIQFKDYQLLDDEHFRMGNYAAVHKNHNSLINDLELNY